MCCCTRWITALHEHEEAQTTVEAAFLIPTVCFALAILIQPAVLLYDRCVMESAAAETCRLAATAVCDEDAIQGFAKRRLAALPNVGLFHSEGCDWDIEIDSGSGATSCAVRIKGHVKTVPLLGLGASTLTSPAGDGCALLQVEASSSSYPTWMDAGSGTPEEWVSRWE